MRRWLYTPRSGSNLFTSGWGVTVATRPWGESGTHTAEKAGGSHDIECHDVVQADAARAGDHWRDSGRAWLSFVVAEIGGAAADDCGVLLYYAPSRRAAVAVRLLFGVLGVANGDQTARLRLEADRDRGAWSLSHGWVDVQMALAFARDERIEAQRAAFEARLTGEEKAR